jgi:asparagine synthase (glutamine-hydrolysing)
MYHFYGIIDRSFHRHEGDHSQSITAIRKKFPSRSAAFDLTRHERFLLFGTPFRSARAGMTELFIIGEIYNGSELFLKAHDSLTIEEALLHLLLQNGEGVLSDVNGSFLIVILEHDSGKSRIINDPMGTMQVFFYADKDFILFGSELKYLFCHPSCPRRIDWTAALRRPIPFLIVNAERHDDAWFTDIFLLEEGSILEMNSSGKSNIRRYWDPWQNAMNQSYDVLHTSEEHLVEHYCEAYMALLEDAVRIRAISQGSAYSMFSGGLDSTIVAALAKKYVDVGTFSFATQATVRDGATGMCLQLAEDLGISNTQVVIPFDDLVTNGHLWTKHIWSMESPLAHKDAIGKMILHAAISTVQPDVRNIMSGTGSDQLNGGLVRWFVENADDDSEEAKWDRVIDEIRTEMLKPVIGHQYDTFWGGRDLLSHDFLSSISKTPLHDYPWPEFVRGCLHANQYVLVWDELRAAAWHHRGVRFPFMDHRFVPFVLNIPPSLHGRLFFDKQILRRGARNHLPTYLTEKPKAPVIKPGEDRRMNMYKEILLSNGGFVMEFLMESLKSSDVPIDRNKFEHKVNLLLAQPDQAGWAYLMHLAGLVLLDQLPEQDERSVDMHELVMPHVEVLSSRSPTVMTRITKHLSVLSEVDVLNLPLSFAPQCSLVSDVFTGAHFLVKDGEMCYQLDDDCQDWQTFLRSVDNVRTAKSICSEEGLDLESIHAYFRTSLEEGILSTTSIVHHETV